MDAQGRPTINLGLKPTPALPAPPPRSALRRLVARVLAAYLVTRALLVIAAIIAVAIVVTALVGGRVESIWARLTIGLGVAAVLPLIVRGRLRQLVARRTKLRPRLGGLWFVVGWNLATLALLCLGFSDATGRALRRRGDWFLGETDGYLPRRYRRSLVAASQWMERFDLPAEAQQVLAEAILPQEAPRPIYTEGKAPPPEPERPAWYHPLVAPRTAPPNSACRFGAPRPGHRPAECELGHCGIDLVQPEGRPVHAVYDGVVIQAVRDEIRGGIAGRFIRLSHKEGAVFTSYVHLRDLRADLRVGTKVRGGEAIGTVGRTGCKRGGAHLHFALAVRRGGGVRYIDPEQLVALWRMPGAPTGPLVGSLAPPEPGQQQPEPEQPEPEQPEHVLEPSIEGP
jgi:hypothetical protein